MQKNENSKVDGTNRSGPPVLRVVPTLFTEEEKGTCPGCAPVHDPQRLALAALCATAPRGSFRRQIPDGNDTKPRNGCIRFRPLKNRKLPPQKHIALFRAAALERRTLNSGCVPARRNRICADTTILPLLRPAKSGIIRQRQVCDYAESRAVQRTTLHGFYLIRTPREGLKSNAYLQAIPHNRPVCGTYVPAESKRPFRRASRFILKARPGLKRDGPPVIGLFRQSGAVF